MKFNELAEVVSANNSENLMIVDSFNLAFRYKHGGGSKSFSHRYIDTVRSLARTYGAKLVIILGDGGSSYRKSIYPEYKANRKIQQENQTEEEKQSFLEFLNEYTKTIEALEEIYPVIKYVGVEADDLAAYICDKLSDGFNHTWLISSDKDWDLLIDDKVSRFSFITRKEYTKETWDGMVDLSDYITLKVLMGDKGDNVPGVPGVGEKRAASIINQYGNTFDIYDTLPIDSKLKYMQSLNTFKEQLLTNQMLMDLREYCASAIGEHLPDLNNRLELILGAINDT